MARRARGAAPADIEAALAELGVRVHRSSDDEVVAYCPGHPRRVGREERHPSWSVNRLTGLHNCYSCGFSGTFLDLVMELLYPNDVFRAARWMRQFGINLARARDLTDYESRKVVEEQEVLLVPETRLAMYDPTPPDWALEERRISLEACQHYGVRWNAKHDSWIIPVRMPTGELAGWQEKWEGRRRFLNDPREMKKSLCLFGLDVFPVGEPAVLMESPLDVLRLYTVGYEGGLSSFGAAVSQTQMRTIVSVTDEMIVALDNDEDGRMHAEELRVGKWERGKLVSPGWRGKLHMRFFNYRNNPAKDIGDSEDGFIEYGLANSQHASVVCLANAEQERERGLHRNLASVPRAPRRANGRPRALPADRGRGNGKDAHDHRRSRGAR